MEGGRVRLCVLMEEVDVNCVELKVNKEEEGDSTLLRSSDAYSSGSKEETWIS